MWVLRIMKKKTGLKRISWLNDVMRKITRTCTSKHIRMYLVYFNEWKLPMYSVSRVCGVSRSGYEISGTIDEICETEISTCSFSVGDPVLLYPDDEDTSESG